MTSGGFSTAFQVVLSLAVVIAVVVVAARLARRAGIKGPGADLRVLDRAGLSRETSVAVVAVGERRLVVGVSPHGVSLLTELTEEVSVELPAEPSGQFPAEASGELPTALTRTPAPPRQRQATGSVLAPATWKQGIDALRELTTRKG